MRLRFPGGDLASSVSGHFFFVEGIFLRHPQPEVLAVLVERVSEFDKNPVCGFIGLSGQEPSTKVSNFGFGGHEAASGNSYVGCRILPDGSIRCLP